MTTKLGTDADEVFSVGGTGPNTLNGGGGNDVLISLGNSIDQFDIDYGTLTGTDAGIDIMQGGDGDDTYGVDNISDQVVETNSNALIGGIDTIIAKVSYTLSSNVENLTLKDSAADGTGNNLNNTIIGTISSNTLDGGGGVDLLNGGNGGGDTFVIDNVADAITKVSGVSTDISSIISTVDVDITLANKFDDDTLVNITNVTLKGLAAANVLGNLLDNHIIGNAAVNTLDGGAGLGKDTIDGGGGADTMIGENGDDVYFVDNVGDRIIEFAGEGGDVVNSTISVNLGNVNGFYDNVDNLILIGTANINGTAAAGSGNGITGNSGRNILTGLGGDDILNAGVLNTGSAGDTMIGGFGNDTFIIVNANDVVRENLGEGTDEVVLFTSFSLVGSALLQAQEIENMTLAGPLAISGTGNTLANIIVGNSLDNTLDGYKNTGPGVDTLEGGDGDDTYIVNNLGDFVDEILDQGTDTVQAAFSYTLTTFVENLVLREVAAPGNILNNIDGFGNAYDNTITGNSGDNTLDGGVGADTLMGGAGNDVYVVDQIDDVASETNAAGNDTGGSDTIKAAVSFTLGAHFENLILTGALDIDGTGNSLGNAITGNGGTNTLDGGGGDDILTGLGGNDTYILDANDTVFEAAAGGTDTVISSVSIDLSAGAFAGQEIENITLTGSGNLNATGNDALVNTLIGNTGDNILDGRNGADTMIGDAGNDTYIVDNGGDVVTEGLNFGTDTVKSSVTFSLLASGANVENLVLTSGLATDGTGNGLDNTLDGSGNGAANVLTGGLGNDTYFVDGLDSVVEVAGQGTDTINSSVTFDLSLNGANVENLTLTGSANINGTGDGGDNTLTGNSGINNLTGLGGNDTYFIGAGDTVTEAAGVGGGIDTIVSTVSFNLTTSANNVENLTLIGAAISGTGDGGDNFITGNALSNILSGLIGDDTLDGGTGNDTLTGGVGNDLYVVDSSLDKITELAGGGTDMVNSTATNYTLAANVDDLTLLGTGNINGTGNGDVNLLIGNTGNNSLDGGAGADFMSGGAGDDTYIVDDINDTAFDASGIDTIRSSITTSLANVLYTGIENLTLTGTAAINGTGNGGDNTLTGNSAANVLTGGAGNDTYYADSKDTIVEAAGPGGGIDTLIVTLTSGSFVVPVNVENIIIIGTGNVNLTGDTTSNTLTGNAGNNTLDGGGGPDLLSGGKGADVYIVDNAADNINENAGEGTDTVRSSVTFTLTSNVENLILTGVADINGIGNEQDNIITGNSGDNTLDGGISGSDKLIGGLGDDTYVVDTLRDTLTDSGGNDSVVSSITYTLKTGLENLDLAGTSADDLNGTGNGSANIIVGNDGANTLTGLTGNDILYGGGVLQTDHSVIPSVSSGDDTLDGGTGSDTMIGMDGDDVYFVDSTGDVVTEVTAGGTDTANVHSNFVFTQTGEVENITITGTFGYSVTADDSANTITGNTGANHINGMGGADTIDAGDGNDVLDGGTGDDLLIGGKGQNIMTGGTGVDTFQFGVDSGLPGKPADVITDFSLADGGSGDKIDISAILAGYDPLTDTLSDFVHIRDSGSNTVVQVDVDGTGTVSHFLTIAVLQGVTGLTGEAALVASGNLIVS